MLEIEIDGKKLNVQEGTMIIEAADSVGIYIPRYCYHKKLSIAANCRMCLVEVEKVGKPLPACATPVTPNMKVFTQSPRALQAQRAVMEFLLINHPLDCPVCDQGGECELQDLSVGFGRGFSRYNEPKRAVPSENIGPLIETWMTRCIHCTRCVRFGEEIAGLREMGATGRGEDVEIGTYVKHFLKSEISGNIIDICPVGALTNKPHRYAGRGWEYREHPTVSPHDCVGTNMFVHSRGFEFKPEREIMRAVPRENEAINETWMADRDRYNAHGLYHNERVYKPRMKKNNRWIEVEWDRALLEIADRMHAIAQNQGPEQLAAIASPNSTVEELYLLQKLMRGMGSNNIDYRFREQDFSDQHYQPLFPGLETKLTEIKDQQTILIVGANPRYEAPMINHRIRQATAEDATKILAINPKDYTYTLPVSQNWVVSPALILDALAQVVKAAAEIKQQPIAELSAIQISEAARNMAQTLINSERAALFYGELVLHHPRASEFRALFQRLKKLTGVAINAITEGANTAGAWLAGAVPHRGPAGAKLQNVGVDCGKLLTTAPVRSYLLFNVEPEFDFAFAKAALAAFDKAGLVVAISAFATEKMQEYADFILPLAPFTETSGTFVNAEGQWQAFAAATVPHGDAKPGWKMLRVLANFLKLDGFEYKTSHEVQYEIHQLVEQNKAHFDVAAPIKLLAPANNHLTRLAPWLIYRVDSLVRRSEPLQETMHGYVVLAVNAKTAQKNNLRGGEMVMATQADHSVQLKLEIDDRLADDTVWLPSGLAETSGFGSGIGAIELRRAE